jgi:hypothetical protein
LNKKTIKIAQEEVKRKKSSKTCHNNAKVGFRYTKKLIQSETTNFKAEGVRNENRVLGPFFVQKFV